MLVGASMIMIRVGDLFEQSWNKYCSARYLKGQRSRNETIGNGLADLIGGRWVKDIRPGFLWFSVQADRL